ncbi:MAG: protein-L-isoaspartate(D-aspartate) O-methyltransferase [Thermodesulfobacteriota bacterium]|nr:protein-L-isoaspartate(D-aspartate) O-methyltransferase [Thermodesulfobacteriota bacterium]
MDFQRQRDHMVENQLKRRGIVSFRMLEAMRKVPRERFVPCESISSAYNDSPLSIGEGQTISQPYMVALMTECLNLEGKERVLEIGTGSGYQTAILAELAYEVYTIELHDILSERAKNILLDLGYHNIEFRIGDGSKGWKEESPFDGIIVTAGSPDIPNTLQEQLNDGGRLVIPVGSRFVQTLFRITKKGNTFHKKEFTSCVFVPLVGEYGWKAG